MSYLSKSILVEKSSPLSLQPETPGTSGSASDPSGKSSVPVTPGVSSTGHTSVDSKTANGSKLNSPNNGHGPDACRRQRFCPVNGAGEYQDLSTIQEQPFKHSMSKASHSFSTGPDQSGQLMFNPDILTTERAAAAKIFFETHYHQLMVAPVSPRSLRRREMEGMLYENLPSIYGSPMDIREAFYTKETNHLRECRVMKSRRLAPKGSDRLANSFEVVKILGKGSFGVVRLVRERDQTSGELEHNKSRSQAYAMKVIRKADMLRNSQEGHLRAERDFLVASEGSRWIISLIASFQDAACLYLVMDYMPGGDFLGLLIRDNILSERTSKFYIAEMILCIEESHRLGWIHRDIKPDNFLISASGHLKISDFGLAFDGHWSHDQAYYNAQRYSLIEKHNITIDGDATDREDARAAVKDIKSKKKLGAYHRVIPHSTDGQETKIACSRGVLDWRNRTGNRSLAKSVVGTSQYMAPEVVRGDAYDGRCD